MNMIKHIRDVITHQYLNLNSGRFNAEFRGHMSGYVTLFHVDLVTYPFNKTNAALVNLC